MHHTPDRHRHAPSPRRVVSITTTTSTNVATTTTTTTAATTAATVTCPVCYPAGAFVVRGRRPLGALVAALRCRGRLKRGCNVTPFEPRYCARAPSSSSSTCVCGNVDGDRCTDTPRDAPCTSSRPLQTMLVQLRDDDDDDDDARQARSVSLHKAFVLRRRRHDDDSDDNDRDVQRLLTRMTRPRNSDNNNNNNNNNNSDDDYFAVHVVGHWTADELAGVLAGDYLTCGAATAAAAMTTTTMKRERDEATHTDVVAPALAYVEQLRCYTRACCRDAAALPRALAVLRTLQQREQQQQQQQQRRDDMDGGACAHTRFRFCELFAGIGMFRAALRRADCSAASGGGRCVFAVEMAPHARRVYATNFACCADDVGAVTHDRDDDDDDANTYNDNNDDTSDAVDSHASVRGHTRLLPPPPPLVGDITEVPTTFFCAHDLLTAGFPCQSFAKAGDATGLRDTRSDHGWLFYEVLRVLRASAPRAFVLENVDHVVHVDGGAQLATMLALLRAPAATAHAHTCVRLCNSCHGGGRDVHTTRDDDDDPHAHAPPRYVVDYIVIDGVVASPQTRRRIYLVGVRGDVHMRRVATSTTEHGNGSCGSRNSNEDDDEAATSPASSATLRRVLAHAHARLQRVHAYVDDDDTSCANTTATTAASCARRTYRCVRDVLLDHAPPPSSLASSASSAAAVQRTLASLQLTRTQWRAVQRSATYRASPHWRVAALDGVARTLMGSYRSSYQLYSEFVPYTPATTTTTTASQSEHTRHDAHDDDEDDEDGGDRPALRFYAARECARLQGIDDDFDLLLHDEHACDDDNNDRTYGSRRRQRPLPDGAAYRLVGNAVNPRVVGCLVDTLLRHVVW